MADKFWTAVLIVFIIAGFVMLPEFISLKQCECFKSDLNEFAWSGGIFLWVVVTAFWGVATLIILIEKFNEFLNHLDK